MPSFYITKSNGEQAIFSRRKVERVCGRSGADAKLCRHIAKEVEARLYDGMTTREIADLVIKMLKNEHPGAAARYCLRDAIFKLGPLGFDFEKYIAKLLEAYGYKTELPPILQGACTTHEVDVLAEKDNRRAMIECKFRHSIDFFITIKDTMATWARFMDLVDASAAGKTPHLDECWIVTNSRFSNESLQYGHCKNMVLLSWNHPKERPLPAWIDEMKFYPITVIPNLALAIQKNLIGAGIILVQDLANLELIKLKKFTGLDEKRAKELINSAKEVLQK